jgi:hypothetical protein
LAAEKGGKQRFKLHRRQLRQFEGILLLPLFSACSIISLRSASGAL